MANKIINIIDRFQKDDLLDLLHKNGYNEFDDILIHGGVTTGNLFLNLTEFQMTKWKLSLIQRKKLLLLIAKLKENPEEFINKKDIDKMAGQSEQRLNESQDSRKPGIFSPAQKNAAQASFSACRKCIPKRNQHNTIDHYSSNGCDDDGEQYLIPINKPLETEDDPYEVPREKEIFTFQSASPSKRPPLPLPRENSDRVTPEIPTLEADTEYFEPAEENEQNNKTYSPSSSQSHTSDSKRYLWIYRVFGVCNWFRTVPQVINSTDKNSSPRSPKGEKKNLISRPLPSLPSEDNLDNDFKNVLNKSKSKSLANKDETITSRTKDDKKKEYPMKPKFEEKPLFKPPTFAPQTILNFEEPVLDSVDKDPDYYNFISHLDNKPFYCVTDRKGAKRLLKNLHDGAFLFRPSKTYFLSLSVKFNNQYYNLGIEKRKNGKIRINTDKSEPSVEFSTLMEMVEFYARQELTFDREGQIITLFLVNTFPVDK